VHNEILNSNQTEILPLIKQFKREFYLVGGTAIALHIGHRRSIDFDLFKFEKLNIKRLFEKIDSFHQPYIVTRRVDDQINLIVSGVHLTFFEYPYRIPANNSFENIIKLPGLLSLASMKAYALGRRSKWKDYVDLYFILRDHFSIKQIVSASDDIFGQHFSEKLFRAQLSYFEDIDYSESVEYLIKQPSIEEIKEFLVHRAIDLKR